MEIYMTSFFAAVKDIDFQTSKNPALTNLTSLLVLKIRILLAGCDVL